MKKKFSVLLLVVAIVTLVSTISYAYWNLTFEQNEDNVVVTDCFKVTYEEDTNSNIHLDRGYPILDEEGRALTPYVFWMENICTSMAKYQINMESMENSTMPERVLKAMINDKEGVLLRESTEPTVGIRAFKVDEGSLYPGEKKRTEVRLWMDESTTMDDYDAMNKNYVGKVVVVSRYSQESGRYTEEILNGTDPVLSDGLIPVTIENDGTVKKADLNSVWYNYSNQKWANAVILLPENERTEENKGKVYEDLEVIPENDIESYFVWIPRYRYQIFNNGNYIDQVSSVTNVAQIINVVFENKDTPKSTGNRLGLWLTHPAFTAFETNGMWVGKFETGYKNASNKTEAEKNENNPGKVHIKPNVNSWRNIQPANAYYTSYNYKRSLDSHMMKNTEWGAVAFLQHSHYGSHESVRINNHSDYKTGYAGVNEPTTGYTGTSISCTTTPSACNEFGTSNSVTRPWNTDIGVLASTTRNISGVYDMSGGAWEYVMGVMVNDKGIACSGRDSSLNSGFNGPYCNTTNLSKTDGVPFPTDNRYYDLYTYGSDDEHYDRRILGDATGEMGPFTSRKYVDQIRQVGSWHADEGYFVSISRPWFRRSGDYYHGISAGIFDFYPESGFAWEKNGFRIVLTPQEV